MNRREALTTMGALGAMGTGILGGQGGIAASAHAAEQNRAQTAFASSFAHFKEQLGPTKVSFDRPLPDQLEGVLYRNGPALMERSGTPYHHWFDGDGMIQSFRLQGQTLTHLGRMVNTTKYVEEKKAGEFLWSGFGTAIANSKNLQRPDDINVANISVLPMGEEVLALWEAGSPWRLDADTLETLGRKTFSTETDGLPFSAHPRIDRDGRIWNFGYMSGSNQMALYELSPDGKLKRASIVQAAKTNMVHDFAMTDQYLIFALMPIDFTPPTNGNIPSFLSMLSWDDASSVDILVIDKETLTIAHKFEMPPFFAFHFGNAWQDGGQLRIEMARAPEFETLMTQIKQATLGLPTTADAHAPAAADIVLDLSTGIAQLQDLPFTGADFPCFDERYAGERTDTLVMMQRSDDMPSDVFGLNTLAVSNKRKDSLQMWSYGASAIAEEHIFVPGLSATEGEGWLMGTAYNWKSGHTSLSVFDAQHVSDGPVATATLPYGLPIGLHGKFVASNA